jgi:two-component system sensor histidine kinase FlrB
MNARGLSLRTRLLLIPLVGAILPLALFGAWLANSISRSAEELLRARLEESLQRVATGVGARWVSRRADLLTIGEDEAVQQWLRAEAADSRRVDFGNTGERLKSAVQSVTIRPADRDLEWQLLTNQADDSTFTVSVDMFERSSGRRLGALEAQMRIASLVPSNAGWTAGAGTVLGVMDLATGTSLLPLPFDPELITLDRFEWSGEQWLAVRRRLHEPALELVAASSLSPFAQPFETATRQGFIALIIVATLAAIATTLLTRRTTDSLRKLADAATTIAAGQYGANVSVAEAPDEVGRVAHAFNLMSASLRRTLDQLSERQSLAAVGEFAATLAHEVRNPLTAIRIDLQRLEEKLPDDPAARAPAARALQTLTRLDATVTGALRVARSGQATLGRIDLRDPLRAAIHDVLPEIQTHAIQFSEALPAEPTWVMGDAAALYQLFFNLLLNAAQATPANGAVDVSLSRSPAGVAVRVRDTGPGIAAEATEQVFSPFYTTKPGGTGLGLAIARRIATAHGGHIAIEGGSPRGAVAVLHLPTAPNVTS